MVRKTLLLGFLTMVLAAQGAHSQTAPAVAVTAAVVGSMVQSVPPNCVPVNYGGMIYQQCGNTWYQPQGSQYIVVNPPNLSSVKPLAGQAPGRKI